MRKKLISIFACLFLGVMSFSGCTSSSDSGDDTNKPEVSENENTDDEGKDSTSSFKIGLVTDEGGLGDKSFNDSAYKGLEKAEKDLSNVSIQALEPKQDSEYETFLTRLTKDSNLIFGVGYKLRDAVESVANDNADVNFGIIDDVVELPNVRSIVFNEHEGSFLVGAIAGLMTESNKVGFIGGRESDLISKFEAGFAAGVHYVNSDAAKNLVSRQSVKYADSFSDVEKGYELSKSLYGDGCDIIYHAAGGVGIGMFNAAAELGKWGIGVDQDQSLTLPERADVILTSMIKRVDVATYEAIKDLVNGDFKAGLVELGIAEGAIGIAETSNKNVPQDILDQVKEIESKIISGEIIIPKTLDELKDFAK